jgi:hypothetical protein
MINHKLEDAHMKKKNAKAATKRGVVSAPGCSAISESQISEWAERHNFNGSPTDLRCAFEDAATLHPLFAYESISEVEEILGAKVGNQFRQGFEMGRVTMGQLRKLCTVSGGELSAQNPKCTGPEGNDAP